MNIRQQRYKRNRILGMNQYNAAKAAGYSDSSANKSNRIEKGVNGCISNVLEQQGLTDKVLVDKLIELLGATKVIGYLHNYGKDTKGNIEKMKPDEVISNEFLEIADNQIRAKALELALKLKGQLRDKVDHDIKIAYTSMTTIRVEADPMELDLGEEVVENRITGMVE